MLIAGGRFIGLVVLLILIFSPFGGVVAPAAVIRVDWTHPAAQDVAAYRVRYSMDGVTFPYGVYISDPDTLSHHFTGLEVDTTYYFKIQSVDTSGNRSDYSDVTSCKAVCFDARLPTIPAIVGLAEPQFECQWDVSEFYGAAGAGLEVSTVNDSFANPNGSEWDPDHCCYSEILSSPAGTTTLSALDFQGPGLYEFRVVALDGSGAISGCFSDSAGLQVIAGAPEPPELILTGPGPGPLNPPLVRQYDPFSIQAGPLLDFPAYGVERYGVNVAAGDINGNGRLEIVTGPGPGPEFGPQVRVFDDAGNSLHADFFAYGTLRFGVKCTTGDVDGDQVNEIITTPGPGEVFGPHVRGWKRNGAGQFQAIQPVNFMAYGTMKYGANGACGDIDGDGLDEIVTGAGPGPVFGPHVRAFDYDGTAVTAIPQVNFMAYGTLQFGVNVCCGDIDGDGFDEIVTGPGPGLIFGPHVRAFDYDGSFVSPVPGASFMAGEPSDSFGVNVSCGDVDGDGVDEVVTAPGPGPGEQYTSRIRGWNYHEGQVCPISGLDFLAYDEDQTFGARVAVARGAD